MVLGLSVEVKVSRADLGYVERVGRWGRVFRVFFSGFFGDSGLLYIGFFFIMSFFIFCIWDIWFLLVFSFRFRIRL